MSCLRSSHYFCYRGSNPSPSGASVRGCMCLMCVVGGSGRWHLVWGSLLEPGWYCNENNHYLVGLDFSPWFPTSRNRELACKRPWSFCYCTGKFWQVKLLEVKVSICSVPLNFLWGLVRNNVFRWDRKSMLGYIVCLPHFFLKLPGRL